MKQEPDGCGEELARKQSKEDPPNHLSRLIKLLAAKEKQDKEAENQRSDWVLASKVMDRFFLVTFTFINVTVTTGLLIAMSVN